MKLLNLKSAQEILMDGGVVAIPTETVYGLAGWIESQKGLKEIFAVKERPFFDPLIVHIDSIESAKKLTSNWTKAHDVLAKATWPGPLTLIADKNPSINPLITAGLNSVGLRCPNHPETLKLLSMIPGGLAAPSANKFGKTSPTTSGHVFQEFGNSVGIIEGGASEVGIESTVIGIRENGETFEIQIFRPGFYTAQMLKEFLAQAGLKSEVSYAESPVAPGQLKHHYMPKIPLVIVSPGFKWEIDHLKVEDQLRQNFKRPVLWKQPTDSRIASRELYQKMREFDEAGFDLILSVRETLHQQEEWLGIWNRLEKAQSLDLVSK